MYFIWHPDCRHEFAQSCTSFSMYVFFLLSQALYLSPEDMLDCWVLNLILGIEAVGKGKGVRSRGTEHEENFYSLVEGGLITGSPSNAGPASSDWERKAFSNKASSFWFESTQVLSFPVFSFNKSANFHKGDPVEAGNLTCPHTL